MYDEQCKESDNRSIHREQRVATSFREQVWVIATTKNYKFLSTTLRNRFTKSCLTLFILEEFGSKAENIIAMDEMMG